MYTDAQQTYTLEEQKSKARWVADALARAYEGMEDGSVASITYHIQTTHKANPPIVHASYTVVDNGSYIESGILTVRATRTEVEYRDNYNGPSIHIEWYAGTHATTPVCELLLNVDPRAVIWTISDVIESIEIDDGVYEHDLLDWYSDVCSRELYDDITDQQEQEFED